MQTNSKKNEGCTPLGSQKTPRMPFKVKILNIQVETSNEKKLHKKMPDEACRMIDHGKKCPFHALYLLLLVLSTITLFYSMNFI